MDFNDADGDEPRPASYLDSVKRENWDEPERAMFQSRDGQKLSVPALHLRVPEPERIPVYEDDERIAAQRTGRAR